MNGYTAIVATAAGLAILVFPLLFGLTGLVRNRAVAQIAAKDAPSPWTLIVGSSLLYALAFSIAFFVQELFLVLPKAFTPGLRPTLFHNNHDWDGDNPLASLFQGTGALACVIVAAVVAAFLKRRPPKSVAWRLFAIWIVFHGSFQSLPQVVLGSVFPRNDVGRAMSYLNLTASAKLIAAFLALAAIVAIAFWLARRLLESGPPDTVESARGRMCFIFRVATLPALLAIPVIILFRVPGSIDQVLIVPVAVTVIGIAWIQAGAWSIEVRGVPMSSVAMPIRAPLIALLVLFAIFQLILRPGIAFY